MGEPLLSNKDVYYMKGRSKYLFWPLLVILLLSLPLGTIDTSNLSSVPTRIPELLYLLAAISLLGIPVLYFVYGIRSNLLYMKVFFLVLSCIQMIISSIYIVLNLLHLLGEQYGYLINLLSIFGSVMNFILLIAWAAFAVCAAINRNTKIVLRISAILLLVETLYINLFGCFSSRLMDYFSMELALDTYNKILAFNTMVHLAALVFFFAALSFSKQKQPKVSEITKDVIL